MNQKTFPGQSQPDYKGKVRDMYPFKDGLIAAYTSNRISVFDVVLPVEIPYKGAVLNAISNYFLESTKHIAPNWYLRSPNPNITIGLKAKPYKFEVVVRRYLLGSMYRAYKKGQRDFWGVTLPDGMKEFDLLPKLMVTPSTKAEKGHDMPITYEEIIAQGLALEPELNTIYGYAKNLFVIGEEYAATRNLIFADTKYEFGETEEDGVTLIDEIHTPDSSRYYYKDSFDELIASGQSPKQLSKEFVRDWIRDHGFEGEPGQKIPEITEETIAEFSNLYKLLHKEILGYEYSGDDLTHSSEEIVQSIKVHLRDLRGHKVAIVMGSISDLPVMEKAAKMLDELCVGYTIDVNSAHRTPEDMFNFAKNAHTSGYEVIIAGAGGAAHLPGMVASLTPLQVFGVPVVSESNKVGGLDSIYSILQMPPGVPVATVAVNAADNAAILAVQALGIKFPKYRKIIIGYKDELKEKVAEMKTKLQQIHI